MWKDYFYFSKTERRAIVALTAIVIIVQVLIWTEDEWITLLPERWTKAKAIRKELKAFEDSLSLQDKGFHNGPDGRNLTSSSSVKLIPFDPNTADSMALKSLGLPSYVVRNILKYRNKGGSFRKAEDFSRVYGLDPAQFARMRPYIRIGSGGTAEAGESGFSDFGESVHPLSGLSADFTGSVREVSDISGKNEAVTAQNTERTKTLPLQWMEINQADTVMLQQLKGVGGVTANKIAQYRKKLGGFYSVGQLKEINGIYPDVLDRLQTLLKVDTAKIVKINVNKASLERLKSHPYLSFYQARVIVELRKARSGIRSLRELAEFKEFSKADLERLRWYLVF